jgi:hypothetical protein
MWRARARARGWARAARFLLKLQEGKKPDAIVCCVLVASGFAFYGKRKAEEAGSGSSREVSGLKVAISPIGGTRSGPFPPPISPEGIARVPPTPTQLGPAPAAERPRGRQFCLQHEDTKPAARREGDLYQALGATRSASRSKWFASSTRCDDRTTQCPLATGFPTSFGPKGKHSFHQALTNYLSNHPMFCSEQLIERICWALGPCLMPSFPSACRGGECPQLRPCSVHR